MTASRRIDKCSSCNKPRPWEWAPPIVLAGRTLIGTGVWRSSLVNQLCPDCLEKQERQRRDIEHQQKRRLDLVKLFGGQKPYDEFSFETYQVDSQKRRAFELARAFQPAKHNLYLWGACGLGKTHLAFAAARVCYESGHAIEILTPPKLTRRIRMQSPADEQMIIDHLSKVPVFVLDDLGVGAETPYFRHVLQEVIDTRIAQNRAGLILTTNFSLSHLASRLGHDAIPSRLASMCQVIEITGLDHRIRQIYSKQEF